MNQDSFAGRGSAPPILFLLSVGVSLVFSLLLYPVSADMLQAPVDPDRFGEIARNLYHGNGFAYSNQGGTVAVLDRAPLYPAVLALLFSIVGSDSPVIVQVFQALCNGLTGLIVFQLGRILFSRRVGTLAQFFSALHPMLIWYSARIWTESFYALLVTAFCYASVLLTESPSLFRSARTAVLLALAGLTKAILLPFALLLSVLLLVRHGRRAVGFLAVFGLTAFLLLIPWTIRNHSISGGIVPVHTSLGMNMIEGDVIRDLWVEKPLSNRVLWEIGKERSDSLLAGTGFTPADPAGDRMLLIHSLKENAGRPLGALKRLILNAFTFLYYSESPGKSIVLLILQFPLALAVLVACLRGWSTGGGVRVVILMVVYFISVHAAIFGWARFSLPIVPLCLILASSLFKSPSPGVSPEKFIGGGDNTPGNTPVR